MDAYFVLLAGVAGVDEFDSTLCRALPGKDPGEVDIETVVEAEDGEQAVRAVRRIWGVGGRVEGVIRLAEKVLPRLSQRSVEGDSTLGKFHRRGPSLRMRNRSEFEIEATAILHCLEWGRFYLLRDVELEVWKLGDRPEPVRLAPGEEAHCEGRRAEEG